MRTVERVPALDIEEGDRVLTEHRAFDISSKQRVGEVVVLEYWSTNKRFWRAHRENKALWRVVEEGGDSFRIEYNGGDDSA